MAPTIATAIFIAAAAGPMYISVGGGACTGCGVALIDIELPDIKGTELLCILKEKQPKMVRIIITGHPSVENAAKSVNEKADAYIT